MRNIANKKEKISLLKDVSGILYPGFMTALVRNPMSITCVGVQNLK